MSSERFTVHVGDNLPILKTLPDNSVDAIVTDPPAGIGFMGKEWDKDKGGRDKWIEWMAGIAAECLRVIKPGGHALVWALPRTSHWTATAWENAGWEPRDRICHVFSTGFPKSANISKMIDKAAGAEREVVGIAGRSKIGGGNIITTGMPGGEYFTTAPATDAAKQWDGWGTALKPAVEDYWLFRKPIEKGLNIAQNVLEWGTGGVNVDGCRVGTESTTTIRSGNSGAHGRYGKDNRVFLRENPPGRFPANLIHDGSDEVVGLFPVTGPSKASLRGADRNGQVYGTYGLNDTVRGHDDQGGSAARFFYAAKASRSEREAGLEGLEERERQAYGDFQGTPEHAPKQNVQARNHHPTVKPIALMRYLCRLISPSGGIVLDPFTGSGTTGCAAMLEGFRFIGIEREEQYVEIAQKRIEYWRQVAEHTPPGAEQAQMTLLDMQDE